MSASRRAFSRTGSSAELRQPVCRDAFSLVEILVVVAIIAVLAAIAIPVTGRVLDRGANAQDMNNLRTIGVAISQFAVENNGRIPNATILIPGTAISSSNSDRSSFMELVNRMIPESTDNPGSIYNADKRPLWYSKRFAQMPPGKSYDPAKRYYWGYAWGINTHLWGSTNMAVTKFFGYINQAPDLSRLVLVGEKNRDGGNVLDPKKADFEKNVQTEYRISRDGKAYYLFADYHIESIEGDQSTTTHPEYLKYNPTNRLYYRWW